MSNIGWSAAEDASILPELAAAGADSVEVAPGRLFRDVGAATGAEARAVAAAFRAAGLPVVSMQALLFGRADLTLFGPPGAQVAFEDYLGHVVGLAGALGCGPLVFGSPKNRLKGTRPLADAIAEAAPVVRRLGARAEAAGAVFCIEANAPGYGCDFLGTLAEAAEMVAAADHPGVGLVVDTGNMMMAGEAPAAVDDVAARITHFHASAPELGPVATHEGYIADVLARARAGGYDGIVTLEMRSGDRAGLLAGVAMLRRLIDRGAA